MFVDDLLIFAKGNITLVLLIATKLGEFSNVSGLNVNPSKSEVFMGGIDDNVHAEIWGELQMQRGSFLIRYLRFHWPLRNQDTTNAIVWLIKLQLISNIGLEKFYHMPEGFNLWTRWSIVCNVFGHKFLSFRKNWLRKLCMFVVVTYGLVFPITPTSCQFPGILYAFRNRAGGLMFVIWWLGTRQHWWRCSGILLTRKTGYRFVGSINILSRVEMRSTAHWFSRFCECCEKFWMLGFWLIDGMAGIIFIFLVISLWNVPMLPLMEFTRKFLGEYWFVTTTLARNVDSWYGWMLIIVSQLVRECG